MSLIKRDSNLLTGMDPFFFDRFMEPMWPTARMQSRLGDGPVAPRVDIIEQDKAYLVKADLPGMTKDDIDVSMEGTVLTIKGEIDKQSKQESEQMIRHERYNQQYLRRLDLGSNTSVEGINAEFNNGVLTITVPKVEEQTEKAIEIEVH